VENVVKSVYISMLSWVVYTLTKVVFLLYYCIEFDILFSLLSEYLVLSSEEQ